MTRWLTGDEQRAWRGLLQMSGQIDLEVNRHLQSCSGLSLADYGVLAPLSEAADGRLRPFEIAEVLGWEQSRLSHHLARMEKRELVERQACASDRRGAFVRITDAGRSAIEAAAPTHVARVRQLVFDGLAADQVRALADISDAVLERLRSARCSDPEA